MLRITKLTDYGTVVMAYIASHQGGHAAKDVAFHTKISLPTVSKLLKLLSKSGLLLAQRGAKGGYSLAKSAEQITLADIIQALENEKIALTECGHGKGICAVESQCALRTNWQIISIAIRDTLAKINLAQMTSKINKESIQQFLLRSIT